MDALELLEVYMRRQQMRMYPRTMESELLELPPMVTTFVRLLKQTNLPTQEAFLRAIVAQAPDSPEDGVRARASRTYPALVRQQHFAVALRTRGGFDGVHWVPDLDMLGVDLLVLSEGYALGVALSVQTDTAAAWQRIKAQRHPLLDGLQMVYLNVDPDCAQKIGPFWIHPLADVWRVQEAMETLKGTRWEALVLTQGKVPDGTQAMAEHERLE